MSSVAYAPEEIFLVLSVAGISAYAYTPWIGLSVAIVMAVVVASYRQNVHAYPSGGGDYEVATVNLGPTAGLTVGSALMVDYVLTVAVSISSAASNIGSALPFVAQHKVLFAVLAIVLITSINLRGIRESGAAFAVPVYAFMIGMFVMLGWGLNVVVGLAGLLDLGYVAFYAVGAYSYALLATNFGLSFWICLPLAGILAAFWGVLLGFPVLRLRGDYLAIVTLAFGEIIRLVLINWQSLTGGPNGVTGIPRPTFFGIPLTPGDDGLAAMLGIEFSPTHRVVFLFYLILALALVTNWVTIRLRRLPIGRAWEALREDEVACRALGINITTTKLSAFAIGAMFGGFAGAFFATRQGFISPESFTFHESALVLAIVVLGGMGSQLGVVLASIAMIGGFELFRGLDQYRMLVFGFAMVLLMIWRPRGLVGHRAPTVFLERNQAISSDLVKEGHG